MTVFLPRGLRFQMGGSEQNVGGGGARRLDLSYILYGLFLALLGKVRSRREQGADLAVFRVLHGAS